MAAGVERPFGFWTAVAMVVGGVVGAGIYVVPSQFAGFGWMGVLAWVIGGAGALVIGRVLSALTAARPSAPGIVAIAGQELGPLAGVLTGWQLWTSYWCANAYIALTAARYAGQILPAVADNPVRQALFASALMVVLTLLNLGGLKGSGRFQVVTSALKLLPLVAVLLILAGMALGGAPAHKSPPLPPLAFSIGELVSATAIAMVAIIGFESASVAAERIRDPARNVARATMAGIALSCGLYLVVCSGIVFTMPADRLAASNAPVALFIGQHWGGWAAQGVALFAVISVVGALNVWVLLQGEVPLGLARAGQLPTWMARTNRHDIAVAPLVLASALTIVLLLLGCWGRGAAIMDFMLRLTAVSGVWIYGVAGITALRMRLRPVLATLSILFTAGIMVGSGLDATLLSILLVLPVLPLYALAQRRPAIAAA